MALVDTSTGEKVVLLTPNEAQMLTAKIKGHVSQAWILLVEAHDRRAHVALGYSTWDEYVRVEFEIGRSQSYRILDQGRVIAEIESAVSPMGDITTEDIAKVVTERKARDIKPHIDEVKEGLVDALKDATEVNVDALADALDDELTKQRAKKAQQAEDNAALADLNEQGRKAGMDLDTDSLAERGGWSTHCRELVDKTPPPADFLAHHRPHLTERHIAQARRAHAWLGEFLELVGGNH